MNRSELVSYLAPLIEPFFAKAQSLNDTRLTKFAASAGVDVAVIKKFVSPEKWAGLQAKWSLEQDMRLVAIIRPEIEEVLKTAEYQSEFRASIISLVKQKHPGIKISVADFERVALDEWREMVSTLPSAVEVARAKVLKILQQHVYANTPLGELSYRRLYREAGVAPACGQWLVVPYRAARAELAARQRNEVTDPPAGSNIRAVPGGWVDLDRDTWKISPGHTLIRHDLRPDIAEIAWPLLKDELIKGEYAPKTICIHYEAYRSAGKLLGSEVSDIRVANLEAVQRAWAAGVGRLKSNEYALRAALVRLFSSLLTLADENPDINRIEILKIVLWLCARVKLPQRHSTKEFLTAAELDALLTCCVRDIEAGFEFLSTYPQLLYLSTTKQAAHHAQPVVYLSTALMILLMAIAGLRPGSVKDLEVTDSRRIRPRLGALVWRHPKKREENIVLTPVSAAILLEQYIFHSNEIRRELSTNRIFVCGDRHGGWSTIKYTSRIKDLLEDFVIRHDLTRDGEMLPLTPTTLRRTYATQQLYRGYSIWFVRAQLGHTSINTTVRYVQFDLFEHPAQVRRALDAWGERVLGLWETPGSLENINLHNRALTFGNTSPEDDPDTSPPQPGCSTCEWLVTGPGFVDEWESERLHRERALRALAADPASLHLVEEAKTEHQRFLDNYHRVKGEARL